MNRTPGSAPGVSDSLIFRVSALPSNDQSNVVSPQHVSCRTKAFSVEVYVPWLPMVSGYILQDSH